MSARKYAQRLQLECSANSLLRLLFSIAVVASILSITLLPLPLPIRIFSCLLIAALAWRCWQRRCELGGEALILTWDGDDRWWWSQGGEERELLLRGDTYVATGVVILNFNHALGRGRRSLVLLPASVGAGVFRRLRVRLILAGRHSVRDGASPQRL
jgi:hypothetical protein